MMRRCALLCLLVAAPVAAQPQPSPHSAYVYPAGGRQGMTFEVSVGGQFLDGATQALLAGSGVTADVISFDRPLSGKEMEVVRNRLKELQQSHTETKDGSNGSTHPPEPWTPEARKEAADLQAQLDRTTRLRATPALSQTVRLRVHVAPDAAPGNHELRLVTDKGLTNPLVFLVDRLPEITNPPQYVPLQLAAGGGLPLNAQTHAAITSSAQEVTLPAVLNGQVMPGSINRYRFHARKGQKIVIAAQTRTLIPFMGDAVPGWFQAALTLSDTNGREIGYADHYRFSQEAVLSETIPADGDYILAVRDVLNRGREDFVYRITIGELPFVSGMFPLNGNALPQHPLELNGWNLDNKEAEANLEQTGMHFVLVGDYGRNIDHIVNPLAPSDNQLPEILETNPSSDAAHANPVKLPVIINGRIDHPGAAAWFRFNVQAGEEIIADVDARRLGSSLDSTLLLQDSAGHEIAFNDDTADKGTALLTDQSDSRLTHRFTAKGTYFLRLTDSKGSGGNDYTYRLRLSPPRPDFDVRMMPSGLSLRPGRTIPVNVQILRHDGFNGEVRLHLINSPPGFALSGGVIPAGVDSIRVGLMAPAQTLDKPLPLPILAEANIANRSVRHLVQPVDDYTQAFAWHEAVPAEMGIVWTIGKEHRRPLWPFKTERLVVTAGRATQLRIAVPPELMKSQITLSLNEPPPGISIASATQAGDTLNVTLQADEKLTPRTAGNLFLDATVKSNTGKPWFQETLPAIPFDIAPPSGPICSPQHKCKHEQPGGLNGR